MTRWRPSFWPSRRPQASRLWIPGASGAPGADAPPQNRDSQSKECRRAVWRCTSAREVFSLPSPFDARPRKKAGIPPPMRALSPAPHAQGGRQFFREFGNEGPAFCTALPLRLGGLRTCVCGVRMAVVISPIRACDSCEVGLGWQPLLLPAAGYLQQLRHHCGVHRHVVEKAPPRLFSGVLLSREVLCAGSLHSEACNSLGASCGVIHSAISYVVACFRASTFNRVARRRAAASPSGQPTSTRVLGQAPPESALSTDSDAFFSRVGPSRRVRTAARA